MLNISRIYGPVFAAAVISLALLGITCAQTAYYFRTYPNDSRVLKGAVVVLLIMEGAHIVSLLHAAHSVYVICKMAEEALKVLDVPLGASLAIAITVVLTATVQSFYAFRIYHLSERHPWQKPLVSFIFIITLAGLCSGLIVNSSLYGITTLEIMNTPRQRDLYSLHLAMCITCDVTISASLVFFLKGMPTGFTRSQNVINRLIVFSIGIGLLTSIISTCSLLAFHFARSLPLACLYVFFLVVNGKFYVNSMLVSLNSRTSYRKMFAQTHTGAMFVSREIS